jgi:hypothetical protein
MKRKKVKSSIGARSTSEVLKNKSTGKKAKIAAVIALSQQQEKNKKGGK